MTPTVFTPAPPPKMQVGKRIMDDHANAPKCSACRGWGPLDIATELCAACWRVWRFVERDAPVIAELRTMLDQRQQAIICIQAQRDALWPLMRRFAEHEDVNVAALARASLAELMRAREPKPPLVDEVAAAREAREVPRLAVTAGVAGVSLDVGIDPPPRRR